jgi:riboflavin synthase
MFTGIVADVGRVRALARGRAASDTRIEIETAFEADAMPLGASIACAGVCLTVIERGRGWFAVEASGETLARTTLGRWRPGARVNLERPLRVGDELGGHIVAGHVDGVGEVTAREADGGSLRLTVAAPMALARYVAPKGSIAVDGVSLTVNQVEDRPDGTCRFSVNIIPFTQTATTLGALAQGDRVNLEVDTLARYLARLNERS